MDKAEEKGRDMKVALYARVSQDDMHCENQKKILDNWTSNNRCEYQYFQEEETTRKTRPVKEFILNAFREGVFDTVVVVKIDRFARSSMELVMNVQEIVDKGGRFISLSNNFDFTKETKNATQTLILQIFAAFAEFEREIIRERTIDGIARARAEGKVIGHPKGVHNRKKRVYKIPPIQKLNLTTSESQKV